MKNNKAVNTVENMRDSIQNAAKTVGDAADHAAKTVSNAANHATEKVSGAAGHAADKVAEADEKRTNIGKGIKEGYHEVKKDIQRTAQDISEELKKS